MIVGEVKEGPARFNEATRDSHVLQVALTRFGCCRPEEAEGLARSLLAHGRADGPSGHVIRMVAFGSAAETDEARRWHTVPMAHVVEFLRGYLREHWHVLRHAQVKDPTVGVLTLLEKFGRKGVEA